MVIDPRPNGQMPAIVRNNVDLPDPDGPFSRMFSPLLKLMRLAVSNGLPLGSLSASSSSVIADPSGDAPS